ncbi:zinc metallopeptidase [Candidatus Soleaferrea massiliensis]|uniref:zinc metallopeptidase n=1 Tax=Candidatus Soleaferrea massiliensis TaxID=1470354 RepID=UPI0005913FCE|nr:zinc metallopeptidase [Candidatus Soleaferrea massiliensis]
MRFGWFYLDIYYIVLIIPAMILALYAQFRVKSTFHRYQTVYSSRGMTGADVAQKILADNGLHHVRIERTAGNLTDHYDPRHQVLRLSETVYDSTSVAAAGVAAHEVGHAIQHANSYLPLKFRNAIIPVTNIGSTLSFPLIIAGIIFSYSPLIYIGIVLFALVALFQLITLPVEFNASSRALRTLEMDDILAGSELTGAKKVLRAAALTYVAALITSLAQLLRLILLFGNNRNRGN